MGAERIKRGTGEGSKVDRALFWHKLHATCDGMAYEVAVCFYIVVEIMAYHGVVFFLPHLCIGVEWNGPFWIIPSSVSVVLAQLSDRSFLCLLEALWLCD